MLLGRLGAATFVLISVMCTMPACSSTANITEVYASLDENGARKRSEFTTDTENIFCMVEYGIGRKDVTIEVITRRTTDGVVTVVGNADFHPEVTDKKPGLFAFRIPRFSRDEAGKLKEDDAAAFDVGRYRCEARLDGVTKSFIEFNVAFPLCPDHQLLNGTKCEGFFPLNQKCPLNGLEGSDEPNCNCTKAGWVCPN